MSSRSGRRPRRSQAREFSAGGVVVRGDELVAIVPTRRAADGSKVLALPKGHVDPGETPIEAAVREVREETGIVAEPDGCRLAAPLELVGEDRGVEVEDLHGRRVPPGAGSERRSRRAAPLTAGYRSLAR